MIRICQISLNHLYREVIRPIKNLILLKTSCIWLFFLLGRKIILSISFLFSIILGLKELYCFQLLFWSVLDTSSLNMFYRVKKRRFFLLLFRYRWEIKERKRTDIHWNYYPFYIFLTSIFFLFFVLVLCKILSKLLIWFKQNMIDIICSLFHTESFFIYTSPHFDFFQIFLRLFWMWHKRLWIQPKKEVQCTIIIYPFHDNLIGFDPKITLLTILFYSGFNFKYRGFYFSFCRKFYLLPK